MLFILSVLATSYSRLATTIASRGLNYRVPVVEMLKITFWRLATLAFRLPSPQEGLTAVFGMRTGVTPPMKHQNGTLNTFVYEKHTSMQEESRSYATPTIPYKSSVGVLVRLGSRDCSPFTWRLSTWSSPTTLNDSLSWGWLPA